MKTAGISQLRIPWFSLACLLVLIALAPYAMSFQPYPPYTRDSLYSYRATLILLGLLVTNAAFAEFIVACFRTRSDAIALTPFAAAFLACAVLGWRSYPYWANGVYQVGIGAFPQMDQDPKGLIPTVWIGELWPLSVMLLYWLCFLAVPALAIGAVVAMFRRRFIVAGATALGIGITVTFMVGFSPDYVTWLLD